MLAGIYRDRVAIEDKRTSPGPTGPEVWWHRRGRWWARVVPMTTAARVQYQQIQSEATHVIILRGHVDLALGDSRFKWREHVLVPTDPPRYPDGLRKDTIVPVKMAQG